MNPTEAAERQSTHENLLAEAIRLLLIVRNDYNSAYSYGVGWVQQVDQLIHNYQK